MWLKLISVVSLDLPKLSDGVKLLTLTLTCSILFKPAFAITEWLTVQGEKLSETLCE